MPESASWQKVATQLAEIGYVAEKSAAGPNCMIARHYDGSAVEIGIDDEDDIVVIEFDLFVLAGLDPAALKRLLELNCELLHGALALDPNGTGGTDRLLFRETLDLDSLTPGDLDASINAIGVMMVEHGEVLRRIAQGEEIAA